MTKGILGRKVGMTQIFDSKGNLIPVTVVECADNVVLQQKTIETDGYVATQLGFETKRESLANKPELGHVKKAETAPKRFIREIRLENSELTTLNVGQEVKVDIFAEGDIIDVSGTSKGKGFAGPIKRHGHSIGPKAHGSGYHRGIGSMGAIKGNMKGKKMPGHMGHETVVVQNLVVALVDVSKNVILVKGAIPGPNRGLVTITSAIKNKQ